MKASLPALFFGTATLFSTSYGHALNIDDVSVDVYGRLHGAISYMDSDINSNAEDNSNALSNGDVSISSNSSRLGFKGTLPTGIDDLVGIFQLEQTVNLDGHNGDTFTTRDSFMGVRGLDDNKKALWDVKLGYHYTLGKLAGDLFMLRDTAADRRAITGAGANSGNKADKRVANMLLGTWYTQALNGKLKLSLQYSAQAQRSKGTVDDNEQGLTAVGFSWSGKNLDIRAAHDYWKNGTDDNLHLSRINTRYKTGPWAVILLAENLRKSDDLNRKAWGGQIAYKINKTKLIGSVLVADDYKGSKDTGAVMTTIGAERKFSKSMKGYALYTQTQNDDNASYQGVDAGITDELKTTAGQTPKAFSMGVVLSF